MDHGKRQSDCVYGGYDRYLNPPFLKCGDALFKRHSTTLGSSKSDRTPEGDEDVHAGHAILVNDSAIVDPTVLALQVSTQ